MRQPHPKAPEQKPRADLEAIKWKDYPRIPPGEYFAYCYWARRYRDPAFRRWTCLLRWSVLSEDMCRCISKRIPLWFPLGNGDQPKASRRSKYFREWVRANGRPPVRGDRLSPRVFKRLIARVEIGDTDSPAPYSVVKRIIAWCTTGPGHSVSKSTSQGRHGEQTVFTGGSLQ
jgi:hypothetical protein